MHTRRRAYAQSKLLRCHNQSSVSQSVCIVVWRPYMYAPRPSTPPSPIAQRDQQPVAVKWRASLVVSL